MTTEDLSTLAGFEVLIPPAEPLAVESIYCADLLSWAMGKAPEGCAWCTVMGNTNAIAVASLADVAALVLCEGATLDEDARIKAGQHEICVLSTQLPAFEAGIAIAKSGGLYNL